MQMDRCRNRRESGRRYCICQSICQKAAGCIVAITGAIDLVEVMQTDAMIRNGRPEMGKITGTGCQLSGMMTAFLTAESGTETGSSCSSCMYNGAGRRDRMELYAER